MPSLIQVGDLVEYASFHPRDFPRAVLSIDGNMAKLDGLADEVPVQQLAFPTVTTELIARWLMSREEDDVPSVIAWMEGNPEERKPHVLANLHSIVSSEAGMARFMMDLPAKTICVNDSAKAAEEVLKCLLTIAKK